MNSRKKIFLKKKTMDKYKNIPIQTITVKRKPELMIPPIKTRKIMNATQGLNIVRTSLFRKRGLSTLKIFVFIFNRVFK
jgi:hypothetical protein